MTDRTDFIERTAVAVGSILSFEDATDILVDGGIELEHNGDRYSYTAERGDCTLEIWYTPDGGADGVGSVRARMEHGDICDARDILTADDAKELLSDFLSQEE